jgi:hypothetical protein
VYDITNIVPYIMKYKKHPVSGEPLSLKDVVQLHFHKNADGRWATFRCPSYCACASSCDPATQSSTLTAESSHSLSTSCREQLVHASGCHACESSYDRSAAA